MQRHHQLPQLAAAGLAVELHLHPLRLVRHHRPQHLAALALEIGAIQNFDASQSQELLRSLTTGLGVALLTTMVGLVGNILLGLQLTRLDRYADALVAEAQRRGLEP